eukprot:GHRR01025495.1.p1 GENE.GHRR01025495.1~~GHRR01025495.1.p1  ORF type:complete len:100 (+),score=10.63 GHRR01025495.1:739-1038(+)
MLVCTIAMFSVPYNSQHNRQSIYQNCAFSAALATHPFDTVSSACRKHTDRTCTDVIGTKCTVLNVQASYLAMKCTAAAAFVEQWHMVMEALKAARPLLC